AYVMARNKAVWPTLADIAQRSGGAEQTIEQRLGGSGAVFGAPAGGIVPADAYLSGNVRQKLREAQARLAAGDARMQHNIEQLESVKPEDIPYFNTEVQLGATWVPPEAYEQYVAHMLGLDSAEDITAKFANGRWKVSFPSRLNDRPEARTNYGTGAMAFSKIVKAAVENRVVTIKEKDSDGSE